MLGPSTRKFAKCVFYLDDSDSDIRRAQLAGFAELVLDALAGSMPAADLTASRRSSVYAITTAGQRRASSWRKVFDRSVENMIQSWETVDPRAVVAEVELTFGQMALAKAYVVLELTVVFTADIDSELLVHVMGTVGDAIDCAHAEASVNKARDNDATTLDEGLDRRSYRSADQSREILRGYNWLTICNKDIVDRLALPEDAYTATGYPRVRRLDSGGILIRATAEGQQYDKDTARPVFDLVRPVLPPGKPTRQQKVSAWDIVLADPRDG